MITLLSPAKSLNESVDVANIETTKPLFLDKSDELIDSLKKLSADQLSKLMKLSQNLSEINIERYNNWAIDKHSSEGKPAVFLFDGDVYKGFNAQSLDSIDLNFAQNNILILSGLYGMLRPLDAILPYRLEMGTKLSNSKGSNLYNFWKQQVTETINNLEQEVVVNLASNEYFSVIDQKKLNKRVITPLFKEFRNGSYKVISFSAKKARGQMARYIVDNTIDDPQELKNFDIDNYVFDENLSKGDSWVFTR